MSIETRLRETGPRGGGGGGSSNSGGLAGTGGFYVAWSADPLLSNEKILTAGANVSVTTDATTITISANTGGAANSGGLAGTGLYYILGSAFGYPNAYVIQPGSSVTFNYTGSNLFISALTGASGTSAGLAGTGAFYLLQTSGNSTLPFSKLISAGSSVTTHTDATNFYINAITNTFAGSGGLASTGGYYAVWSSDPLLSNEKVITAGSSVTTHTDATGFYINATTANASAFATTGRFFVAWSSDPLLSNEKILTAGANISISTDATTITIAANTGGAANSAGLAGTGVYYLGTSANDTWPNWYVIQPGSSVTHHITGSNYYLNAITSIFAGSGGLASTGGYYAVWSADPLLSNEKVITAGSSVTLHTDATAIYINAITNAAGGVVYAPTGGPFITFTSDSTLTSELILRAGSSVTTHTDSTFFYINATTSLFAGSGGLASTGGFYAVWSSDPLLSNEKIITAGSSVTLHTDATAIYINAVTNTFAGSGGLSGTANFFMVWSADPLLSNEKVLTAGSSITTHTDSTAFYVNAVTANALAYVTTDRTITTLFPLTGGGLNLSANRTFSADTAFLVTSNRTINTTFPLAGGGNLGADRTFTITTAYFANSAQFFVTWSSDPLLSSEKVLTAGSSVTIVTDASAIYINAITNTFAGSGGLASTGGFYAVWSADPLLSNEKVITAGSSVTLHTDATAIYINAITNAAGGVVYAPTGGPFITFTSDSTLTSELILRAGTNVTVLTDSTFFYINATTGGGSGTPGGSDAYIQVNSQNTFAGYANLRWINSSSELNLNSAGRIRKGGVAEVDGLTPAGVTGLIWLDTGNDYVASLGQISTAGFLQLPVQAAKLYSNDSAATIDAGTSTWRLLYSQATQQYGMWQFVLPFDYSGNPAIQLVFSSQSSLSVARSVQWIVDQWGLGNSQNSVYVDTFAGANNTTVALSAGYSAGLVQILTVPLTNLNSFAAGNLIKLRVSSSAGNVTGINELVGLGLYYRAGTQSIATGSAGLSGTGGPHISYAPGDPLYPADRVLSSGSSTTVRTDGTNIYVDASTAGLALAADNFVVWSADADLANEKILTAGNGISITTAATTITLSATMKDENFYRNFTSSTAAIIANAFYIGGGQNNTTALATQAMAINTMTAIPFFCTRSMRVDSMAVLCTATVAGCVVRLGLYTNSADNVLQPFEMVGTSAPMLVTPNILSQFQVNQTLSANNMYWFVLDVGTGAATVRSLPLASAYPFLGADSGLGTNMRVAINSGKLFATGLPATWGRGYTFVTLASIPAIAVRMSI